MNLKAVLIAGLIPVIPLPAFAVCRDGKTASWYDEPGMLPKNPVPIGCASRDHKKGTQLHVVDLDTKREVLCVVDDYGPMKWTGCELDAGPRAAEILDMRERGVIRASIRVVGYPWALEGRWPPDFGAHVVKAGGKVAGKPESRPADRARARPGKKKGRR